MALVLIALVRLPSILTAVPVVVTTSVPTISSVTANPSPVCSGANSTLTATYSTAPAYCSPTHSLSTSGCFYGVISNVTFNTLNSSPACISVAPSYNNNAIVSGCYNSYYITEGV